jgi:ribosomal protein S18 acetylase RimI-like enzyme
MIRNANVSDIPRIFEIRGAVHENKLRDPSRVTIEDLRWFIANPGIFVWDEDGRIVGFSAADPRDGSIFALFVAPAFEGREFGRLLFVLHGAEECRMRAYVACDFSGDSRREVLSQGRLESNGVEGDELVFEPQSVSYIRTCA